MGYGDGRVKDSGRGERVASPGAMSQEFRTAIDCGAGDRIGSGRENRICVAAVKAGRSANF